MNCPKCHKAAPPDAVFCAWCGRKLISSPRKPKHSPNGSGSAYKRGAGWVAQAVVGYRELPDDLLAPENARQRVPIKRTKGGFPTKAAALAYVPILKGLKDESAITLQQVYDDWEQWYSPRVDASTMAGYRAAYSYYRKLHKTIITEITAGDLQQCMDDCPRGKRTHQNMKVVAGLLWKYAKSKHIVDQVESETLYTGRGKSVKREALTDIEVEKVRQSIGSIRYAEYVYALCYLGYRPGEMLEIRKDQVIEHKGRLFLIEGKKTDAGRNRTVPVHQKIEDIVRARLMIPGTDLVFPQYVFDRPNKKNDQNPPLVAFKEMTDNYLRSMIFKPMMQQLGIAEGKVPYAARHTFSNKLKKAAGDAIDKAALMGHSSYTFTQTNYQSTDDDERLAIVDSMD